MKKIFSYLFIAVFVFMAASCSNNDDFTESIYDTTVPAVDPTKATYPFDQWLYDNFVKPYNVEVQYQFNFNASDMTFQLSPADYNRSQLLSHFIRHLFYDIYTKYSPDGEDFMKKYGPRMFHFIGSSGYSPTTGTEVLGTASGGVKITLYNVNEMKPYSEGVQYDASDIEVLNERFFHTMHHEFSHILHQTKTYPVTFGQVTSGTYDPLNWQDRDSTTSHMLGYVTQYASSANTEDFVETLSCIITDTDARWMNRIISASVNGVRSGDVDDIRNLVDSLNVTDINNPNAHWNNFAVYNVAEYNSETGTYDDTGYKCLDNFRSSETVVNKENTAYVAKYKYTLDRTYKSFLNEFLPSLQTVNSEDLAGINAILKKISIATTWYTEKWNLHIYALREEVKQRQNHLNEYINDPTQVVIYDIK